MDDLIFHSPDLSKSNWHHYLCSDSTIPANIRLWERGRNSRVLSKGLPSMPLRPILGHDPNFGKDWVRAVLFVVATNSQSETYLMKSPCFTPVWLAQGQSECTAAGSNRHREHGNSQIRLGRCVDVVNVVDVIVVIDYVNTSTQIICVNVSVQTKNGGVLQQQQCWCRLIGASTK